jgi:predicted nucleic acid-binding protein
LEILVDTSVWVDFFNGVNTPGAACLHKLIKAEDPLCISDVILAETLQGFKNNEEFDSAKNHLAHFPIYSLQSPEGYIRAAQLYRTCRKEGITIRKTIDCFIAQTALDHSLSLLHQDNDFDRIAAVSGLRVYRP